MLAAAQEKGIAFYGISEHFDYDYDWSFLDEKTLNNIRGFDPDGYFHRERHEQEDYEGVMNVCIGAEFGYSEDPKVQARYMETYQKYKPDFVINSVHGDKGEDFYFAKEFPLGKEATYKRYLQLIRQSLDVSYPYDIVGHIGYPTRYAPYEDTSMSVAEFGESIDKILKTIIEKNKILEVNSSVKGQVFLPTAEIVQRYFKLGGRNISYASDAHGVERIGDKRKETVKLLKEIGFKHITVPYKGEYIKLEI
jgi:histidinol-phosphatase (PHP family)